MTRRKGLVTQHISGHTLQAGDEWIFHFWVETCDDETTEREDFRATKRYGTETLAEEAMARCIQHFMRRQLADNGSNCVAFVQTGDIEIEPPQIPRPGTWH